jgi:hypothetical protein
MAARLCDEVKSCALKSYRQAIVLKIVAACLLVVPAALALVQLWYLP